MGFVIGITGSGKTTLMSAFATMMNPRWRILTIEDTLELQIPHADWVRYDAPEDSPVTGTVRLVESVSPSNLHAWAPNCVVNNVAPSPQLVGMYSMS